MRLGKGGGAITGSPEFIKIMIQSISTQKKSTGRKRRRWRTHQRKEKELKPTHELHRRSTEKV
jgi:hypothetical protein